MLGQEKNQDVSFRQSSRLGTLIGVFLILLSVLIYVFVTRPLAAEVSTMHSSIAEKKEKTMTLENELALLQNAESELDITSVVKQQQATKAIPLGINQDEVIRDLINIADTYDVELRSLSFGQGGSDQQDVNSLRINSSFHGSYTDLIGFLQGLEQNARLLRVNTISVQLEDLGIGTVQRAIFTLSMEAFYQ